MMKKFYIILISFVFISTFYGCNITDQLTNVQEKPISQNPIVETSTLVEASTNNSEGLPQLDITPESINQLIGINGDEINASSTQSGKPTISNAIVKPKWEKGTFIYDFVKTGQKYTLEYKTLLDGPIYANLWLYESGTPGKWVDKGWVYDKKNLYYFKNSFSMGSKSQLVLVYLVSSKGGRVKASLTKTDEQKKTSSETIIDTYKKVSGDTIFKIIKACDPGGEWDLMNGQVINQVAKGTVTGISIAGKVINAVEIYDDFMNGYSNIEGLSNINGNNYYSDEDRNALKVLLAFELYVKHVGNTFGGGLIPNGFFRKAYQAILEYRTALNYARGENGKAKLTISYQNSAFYWKNPVKSATVKITPIKIKYYDAGDWWDVSYNSISERKNDTLTSTTDQNGLASFNDVRPGLWSATIVKSGQSNMYRMIRVEMGETLNQELKMDY